MQGLFSIRLEWGLVPTKLRGSVFARKVGAPASSDHGDSRWRRPNGFTLIELIITVTVLSVLTMAVIPLVKVSVQRQKEQQLREALRQMREAVDQFHREALSAPITSQQTPVTSNAGNAQPQPSFGDPRIRVYVSDQTIFTADNPDRYPPDLDTLVKGVSVMPLIANGLGGRGNLNVNATDAASEQAATAKTKVYLRAIPVDPMTGKADWDIRSCYQASDDTGDWDRFNVFEVHSKSKGIALNGENYRDW
jgi:general secretion pathway protein G